MHGLTTALNRESDTPLYIQLSEALKDSIRAERLTAGSRLPAVRTLALELGLNPATVVSSYRILEQEGWVKPRQGSGVYVLPASNESSSRDRESRERIEISLLRGGTVEVPSGAIDFTGSAPSPDLFPIESFKKLMNEVMDRDGASAFEYQESGGYRPLREAAAAWFERAAGFRPDVEDVQIVSGAQQGIDLAAKALLSPGEKVLVEELTYRGAVRVFWSRGAGVETIESGRTGPDLESLRSAVGRFHPKLLYATPTFATPTTRSWDEKSSRATLALALKEDFFLLEDDPFSELSYGRGGRALPLKSLDSGDRVIYLKSFSKTLMPGLRLAFMVSPKSLRTRIEAAKLSSDLSTNGFLQRILELYLSRGEHERQLEKLKSHYSGLYRAALEGVAAMEGLGFNCEHPEGGLHLWLSLPPGIRGDDLSAWAREHGCILPSESWYRLDPRTGGDTHLRLGFATVDEDQLCRGLSLLAEGARVLSGPSVTHPVF